MNNTLTAKEIADRIGQNLGPQRPQRASDGFWGGDPATVVTGIATTFAPTFEVLRRSAAANKNMIIARESPSWNRSPQSVAADAVFAAKREFIEKHRLVIYRLREQWTARQPDPQLGALAKALRWDRYPSRGFVFELPATTLGALASSVQNRLNIRAARVLGDAQTPVRNVALSHGMVSVSEVARMLEAADVDAVIVGEPIEWEASPYFQDVIDMGRRKGMIAIGQEASEEPGSGEAAAWLKTFIPEVPVEWIPAGEPFRVLK